MKILPNGKPYVTEVDFFGLELATACINHAVNTIGFNLTHSSKPIEFCIDKINDYMLDKGEQARRAVAVCDINANEFKVFWKAESAETPSSAFNDEIVRAFRSNGASPGTMIKVYFGGRHTVKDDYHVYELEVK